MTPPRGHRAGVAALIYCGPAVTIPARLWLLALAICFFCSGLCALVYQVLWIRILGWTFGVTVYAASAVWAAFMAGLAIGSLAAGAIGDRVRHPLRWFGVTEILIGVTAISSPAALGLLQQAYVSLYPSLPQSLGALTAVRLAIAFAALIVPTALMGATLPLVLKAATFRDSALGRQIGVLYGSNALGAIVGTISAGLYLIPGRGIHDTFLIAAGLNIVVGTAALILSITVRPPAPATAGSGSATLLSPDAHRDLVAPGSRTERPETVRSQAQLAVVLAVFALSGVVSLALEVVWFRVLTLFLRPTVYGFAVMLATILAGISIGSYLITPWLGQRRVRWIAVLACLELAIGTAAVCSFGPLTYLPAVSRQLSPFLARVMPDYLGYPISASLLAIFPTALLMGVAFPIGLHVWTSGLAARGRAAARIGLFYSLNVIGAIVGSLAAGFVLLPRLGSRPSLIALASASFASGLALLTVSELRRPGRAAAAAVAGAAFGLALWNAPDPFAQFVDQRFRGMPIVWQAEDLDSTVTVHSLGKHLMMTINGNHQAGTDYPAVHSHRQIGHLPMILHPQAINALVIGLGGGATAGAVSIHDGVQVDVVELGSAVVRGAAFFDGINYGVLSRPNVHVRVDDARNYLLLTPRRYDVVTADVTQPLFAGAGNLYSAEYFRLIRSVLNPGGLVMQWVFGTEAEYKTVARTFLSVFPNTTAWGDGSLLVGSVEPLRLRRSDFDWKTELSGHAQALKDLDLKTFQDLLATFVAGPDQLRAFVGQGPVLTDDRPLTEYFLSLPRDHTIDLRPLHGDVTRFVIPD
ncbi:MAG: fused MFS/spermidine synthase [Acidobacteriota bacterium]